MIVKTVKEKLHFVSQRPGVYLLKDRQQKILYVGKAKNLRSRLRSHFKPGKNEEPRHRRLMSQVSEFETIVTDSEVEALIMEANFVKEHRPRYNVNLKDDKSFPYIRVTRELYPRIFITRKIVRDGSRYFGPYTDVGSMRQLMNAIRRIFPVRTCNLQIDESSIHDKKHRICLMFHIGRCDGPCEGLIGEQDYQWIVSQVVSFIEGKNDQLVKDLEKRMYDLSGQKRYEDAAELRNQVRSVSTFYSKQKVVDGFETDRDILAVAVSGSFAVGVVFNVREGKIINRLQIPLTGSEHRSEKEVLLSFAEQYYLRAETIPREVFLSHEIDEYRNLSEWLSERRTARVTVVTPQRGKKAELIEMCRRNAQLILEEIMLQKEEDGIHVAASVRALQKDLHLPHLPVCIEAFDNSNIQGRDPVASLVVFENGKPRKSKYRKFKIKTVKGIDDYASMAEVVERRISRLISEKAGMPDLILVDGGKGQLSAACSVLNKYGLKDQPVIGLAKRLEEIYIPGSSDAQTLPKNSASLRLLQSIRDEAHRFAVTFHRALRSKRSVSSELDSIPGIGEKRRKALLKRFGSVEGIRNAALEEIAGVRSMNRKIADRLLKSIQNHSR